MKAFTIGYSIQIALQAAYEAGMSLQIFFSILAGSVILLSINTFIIMPVKHIPWPYPDHHRLVTNCTTRTDQDQKGVAGLRNEAYVEDPADDMGCSEEPHGDGVGLDSVTGRSRCFVSLPVSPLCNSFLSSSEMFLVFFLGLLLSLFIFF